ALNIPMPDYEWNCQSCEYTNNAGLNNCSRCGCPSTVSAEEVDRWNPTKGYFDPDPNFQGRYIDPNGLVFRFFGIGNCAVCNKEISLKEKECLHCGHVFTENEIIDMRVEYRVNMLKGVTLGLIVFPCLIALFLYWK
ncbi:hypothetical protein, partial [Aurantivibrio plasticivorans]